MAVTAVAATSAEIATDCVAAAAAATTTTTADVAAIADHGPENSMAQLGVHRILLFDASAINEHWFSMGTAVLQRPSLRPADSHVGSRRNAENVHGPRQEKGPEMHANDC